MVMKIFYDSISEKTSEIENYYHNSEWENYTIKVHALKSSAKLIGASSFAEWAQLLENAGKAKDLEYIKKNHSPFMQEYQKFRDALGEIFEDKNAGAQEEKPLADPYLIQSVYEGAQEAAEDMDCDAVEEILNEIESYAIPEEEQWTMDAIRKCAENFDYDGILEVLKEKRQ